MLKLDPFPTVWDTRKKQELTQMFQEQGAFNTEEGFSLLSDIWGSEEAPEYGTLRQESPSWWSQWGSTVTGGLLGLLGGPLAPLTVSLGAAIGYGFEQRDVQEQRYQTVQLQRDMAVARWMETNSDFLSSMMQSFALAGMPFQTAEQFLEAFPAPGVDLNDTEKAWFQNALNSVNAMSKEELEEALARTAEESVAAEEQQETMNELMAWIEDNQNVDYELQRVFRHLITYERDEDEVLAAFLKMYELGEIPGLPPGLTEEQLIELMQSYTYGAAEEQVEVPAETETLLQEQLAEISELYRTQITEMGRMETVPPPSILTIIKQPLLVPLELLNLYVENVARPLAGQFLITIGTIAGQTAETLDIIRLYNDARETENFWTAAGTAFENSQVPTLLKFGLEIALDPLTYVGVGLLPKLFGRLGRPLSWIGRLDAGIAETMNKPFDALIGLYRKIPKLPTQQAKSLAEQGITQIQGYLVRETGKQTSKLTGKEIQDALRKAVREGASETAPNDMKVVRELLIANEGVSSSRLLRFSKQVDGFFDEIGQITDDIKEKLYDRIKNAINPGKMSADDAIDNLLAAIGAKNTPENVKLAKQLVDEFLQSTDSFVEGLLSKGASKAPGGATKEVTAKIYNKLFSENRAFYEGAIETGLKDAIAIGKVKLQRGAMASAFVWGVNRFNHAAVIRFATPLVRYPARWFLGFGGYAFFNMTEIFQRSIFSGTVPKRATSREIARMTEGLNIPSMISEDIGMVEELRLMSQRELAAKATGETVRRGWSDWAKDFITGQYWVDMSNKLRVWQHGYWRQRFLENLARAYEKDPTLGDLTRKVFGQIDALPTDKFVKARLKEQTIANMKNLDPDSIRNVLSNVSEASLKEKQVLDILAKHGGELSSHPIILDALDRGVLLDNLGALYDDCLRQEQMHVAHSPAMLTEMYRDVKQAIQSIPLNKPSELLEASGKLRLIEGTYQKFPRVTMENTYSLARRAPSNAAKAKLWDDAFKTIDEAIEAGTEAINDLRNLLKEKTEAMLSSGTVRGKAVKELQTSLDYLTVLNKRQSNFAFKREAELKYRREFFAPKSKGGKGYIKSEMTSNEWDTFYYGLDDMYKQYRRYDYQLEYEEHMAVLTAGTMQFKLPKPRDFTKHQVLTRNDLARMIGAHPNDMTRALIDNAFLQGEDSFTAMVMAYADKSGHKGVTEARVREAYETLFQDITIKTPFMQKSMLNRGHALDAIWAEFQYLRRAPAKGVAETKAIEDFLETTAREVEELIAPGVRASREAVDAATAKLDEANELVRVLRRGQSAEGITDELLDNVRRINPDLADELARVKDKAIPVEGYTLEELRAVRESYVGIPSMSTDELIDNIAGGLSDLRPDDWFKGGREPLQQESFARIGRSVEELRARGVPDADILDQLAGRLSRTLSDEDIRLIYSRWKELADAPLEQGMAKLKAVPELDDAVRSARRVAGAAKKEATSMDEALAKALQKAEKKTPEMRTAWQVKAQEAADAASKDLYRNFPMYGDENALDSFMRFWFPYWNYEWQRLPYLGRLFTSKPVVPLTWSGYTEYTDRGYLRVPGTDLEVNPLRGTVFMGGLFNLFVDFPEFQDENPSFMDAFDLMQRWGFYPNVLVSLPFATVLSRNYMQTGQTIPAPFKSIWALAANIPGLDTYMQRFRQFAMPDRFTDYQLAQIASSVCQDRRLPYTGVDIWNYVRDEIIMPFEDNPGIKTLLESTDAEDVERGRMLQEMLDIWEYSADKFAKWDFMLEQTACMRLYDQDREEARNIYRGIITQITGLSEREQQSLYRRGYKITDFMGRGFTPEERELIEGTEYRLYWSGLTTPLQPYSQQLYFRAAREMSLEYQFQRQQLSSEKSSIDMMLFNGQITIDEWASRVDSIESEEYTLWDSIRKTHTEWAMLPKNFDERMALYAEIGIPQYVPSFQDQLLELYFDLEAPEVYDISITGEIKQRKDYAVLYMLQDRVKDIAEQWGIADEFEAALVSQYASPMDRLNKEITEKYLRPYWDMQYLAMQQFSAREQRIIKEFRIMESEDPAYREQIMQQVTDDGERKIISSYNSLIKDLREMYRTASPLVDYWLWFFGITTTVKTPAAQKLIDTHGRDIRNWPEYANYTIRYPIYEAEYRQLGIDKD